ncbi:hypothetical protein C0431_06030 [bacterium]|jgi:hypothetical protein|nr:hypothetical protein [bacterium]
MSDLKRPVVELEWTVELGKQLAQKRIPVAIAGLVAAGFGTVFIGAFGAMLGIAVVFLSTAELWMPMRFRLTSEEASARVGLSVTAIRWENVKRVLETDQGVTLSPLEKSSRLDAFRGVYLRFSSNRSEVLAKIAELTERNGSDLDREADA